MDLSQLLPLAGAAAPYRELLSALERGEVPPAATAREAAWAYLLAALSRDLSRPVLVVAARPGQARDLLEELRAWLGPEAPLYLFPERDALPYEDLPPDPGVTQQRLSVLAALDAGPLRPFIVASVRALMEGTAPRPGFGSGSLTIRVGDRVDRDGLLRQWVDLGYEAQNPVEVPGAMAHRGGILDLYPPQLPGPVRLELFGGRVESLRRFDPATQRSQALLDSVTIVPAREGPAPEGCLLDYLPPETLLVQLETQSLAAEAAALEAQVQESAHVRPQADLPILNPLLPWPDLMGRWEGFPCRLALGAWAGPGESPRALPFSALLPYGGRLEAFFSQARAWLGEQSRVLIASYQAPRLTELLAEEGIFLSAQLEPAAPEPGGLALAPASLPEGWALPLDGGQALRVITDAELFGLSKRRRPPLRRPVRRLEQILDFAPGDHVVHIDHGIARFGGTALRAPEGPEREYLMLEYAEGDKLYVPSDQVGRVSRYVGAGGYTPALSRLGTQEWARARQRVQVATRDLAKALLETAAAREVAQGRAFAPDAPWQQELESSFPYVETPDQLEAVRAIKRDMETPQPMDRLVCGDVGYGKTEVALRAAFKAVMDGAQVAVLVPTTVLAQQHLQTFRERLGAFPIRVEALSRFLSEREQAPVVAGLADGGVDICIGTHRLLQKDIAFKNLGLVVIDEEQRFGVAHKERLKSMRGAVDVLTLSATPIPRTLHMALAGIRDLSTIETPPEERQPIKTYVSAYEEGRVREAILRELDRGGQVFFIHNRVRHIGWEAAELARLVPQARIAVAHGQMPEEELERVMLEFNQGQTDVLVCTTIIESGLDIPNANTLIVTHADRLGLSQLYQLRGRVGRSAGRAYAYFFYAKGQRLTPAAEQRLRTIFEATELGAGFRIALKDLEIRGAGNLLGAEQSGHIGAVGFTLYTQLLAEAVRELKAAPSPPKPPSLLPPVIDLPLPAYLPPDYVAEMAVRLALYSRMAGLESLEAVVGLGEELRDRFGPLPPPVENLLYLLEVKALAARAGVESLAAQEGELVAQMREGLVWRREAVARLPGVRVSPNQFRLPLGAGRWRETLRRALAALAGD